MDFASDKADLLEIVDFIPRLVYTLVEEVSPEMRPQYRRAWLGHLPPEINVIVEPPPPGEPIRSRLLRLWQKIAKIPYQADELWNWLTDHGLTGEPLRMKHDSIEAASSGGWARKCLKMVISIVGSLSESVILEFLKPVKEFLEFLEQAIDHIAEPSPNLMTLFGSQGASESSKTATQS
jgi:hypothetical protein